MTAITQTINQNYGGFAREIFSAIKAMKGPQVNSKDRFVIYGRGRSGSTLLTDLLNQSEDIYCDTEIFNRPVANPKRFLSHREVIFNKPVYGFKLLSYQLRDFIRPSDAQEFLKDLVEEQGYKVIYIGRENLLRQTLSKHYARFRNTWHEKNSTGDRPKFEVDTAQLLKELYEGKQLDDYERETLKGIPHISVKYERDLLNEASHMKVLARIGQFLNTNFNQAKARMKRISSNKLEDLVANYDEMKAALVGTPFEGYLYQ